MIKLEINICLIMESAYTGAQLQRLYGHVHIIGNFSTINDLIRKQY